MRRWSLVAVVGAIVLPVIMYARDWRLFKECLSRGGTINYATGQCDVGVGHPYIWFHARHPILLGVSFVVLVIALTAWKRSKKGGAVA